MGISCKPSCIAALLGLTAALNGCAVHDTDGSQLNDHRVDRYTHGLAGQPDFNWHLSGDRRVAPRQVFSDQGRIWLQWHPHQAVPTVFADQFGSWQVVDQQVHGQYTVVDGAWQRLMFQGGQLKAMAVYRHAPKPAAASTCVDRCPGASPFDVRLSDGSVRQALRRWSAQANWFFDDAHWSLPVDFPITAPASFNADFELAVRSVLESTRISGQAVKPCFYANHVLRVIPAAQSCDPMADQGDRP